MITTSPKSLMNKNRQLKNLSLTFMSSKESIKDIGAAPTLGKAKKAMEGLISTKKSQTPVSAAKDLLLNRRLVLLKIPLI